jgi:hypothetical protein
MICTKFSTVIRLNQDNGHILYNRHTFRINMETKMKNKLWCLNFMHEKSKEA